MVKREAKLSKRNSFFLFGARGSGKTSLLKQEFIDEKTLYLDLLKQDLFDEIIINPKFFEQKILAENKLNRVVIDEIQKIPRLLDSVHSIIEERKDLQFILTGSSARKLKRGGANLLAGRAFVYNLFPLTKFELGAEFKIENVLQWGTLPKLLEFEADEDKASFLRAYLNTYLKEEILEEQLIRNLEPFRKFLPIVAQASGQILNFSKQAREIGVASQTLENYYTILEDTLLGFFLPVFHTSVRKQETKGKKFYLFDNGVLRALSRQLDLPARESTYMYGSLFEHFIIQEFYRISSYRGLDEQLFYYKTQGGLEVDLIIDSPGRPILAIEIKSTTRVTEDHTKHLEQFKKIVPTSKCICISRDENIKKIGEVICMPYEIAFDKFRSNEIWEL